MRDADVGHVGPHIPHRAPVTSDPPCFACPECRTRPQRGRQSWQGVPILTRRQPRSLQPLRRNAASDSPTLNPLASLRDAAGRYRMSLAWCRNWPLGLLCRLRRLRRRSWSLGQRLMTRVAIAASVLIPYSISLVLSPSHSDSSAHNTSIASTSSSASSPPAPCTAPSPARARQGRPRRR